MVEDRPNYRVFALIHGPVLPVGLILGVDIRKMSFQEQVIREFSPIQYTFSDVTLEYDYRTYVTSLPFVDTVKIRSEHVVVCDIYESDEKAALGGAFRAFDRLCRYLSVVNLHDVRATHGEKVGGYSPYLYQVNKVYSLGDNKLEIPIEIILESGYVYLPNRPDREDWVNSKTKIFLQEISSFHDNTLEQALKYLYRSSIGGMLLDSQEKIALDHMKSIEIIIDSLSKKENMNDRIDEVAQLIGITDQEKEEIKKFWSARSNHGDVAHPSLSDQAERYPNQFPLPSNVSYPYAGHGWIAADIVLKYYEYRKRIFRVDVDRPFEDGKGGSTYNSDGAFGQVNTMWESNHYFLTSKIGDKTQLMKKARVALSAELAVAEELISSEMGIRENNMQVIWLKVKAV
jgi:hypothetical protein